MSESTIDGLQTLKPGDHVVVHSGAYQTLEKVVRVTPTQVILRHAKFSKKSGRLVGSTGRYPSWIHAASDLEVGILAAQRRIANLGGQLAILNWNRLTLTQIEQVVGLVRSFGFTINETV